MSRKDAFTLDMGSGSLDDPSMPCPPEIFIQCVPSCEKMGIKLACLNVRDLRDQSKAACLLCIFCPSVWMLL